VQLADAERAQRNVRIAFDLLEDAIKALAELREPYRLGADALMREWIDEVQPTLGQMLDEVVKLAGSHR
jgi:hypothetical protein